MFQRLEDAKLGEDEEFRSEEHMRAEEALVGLQFLQAGSVKVVVCMQIRHARMKASTRTDACCQVLKSILVKFRLRNSLRTEDTR